MRARPKEDFFSSSQDQRRKYKLCSKSHASISTLQCGTLIVWRSNFDMGAVVPKLLTAVLHHLPNFSLFFLDFLFFFLYLGGKLRTLTKRTPPKMCRRSKEHAS